MKLFVTIFVLALATLVLADNRYTTKYDNVDVDEVLTSDRLFNNYYKCLIGTGKCSPEGRELKRNLGDALTTECSKCSPKQRANSDKVLRYIINNKPAEWKVLQDKFDPKGIYIARYRSQAQARGIKL